MKAQRQRKKTARKKSAGSRAANSKVAGNPAFEAIYRAVERIPRGRVSSYGAIAQVAGLPRRARLVGTALKSAPDSRRLPWHRVLGASGRLAFPEQSDAYVKQRNRLAREGVPMNGRRVDLARYGWPHESKTLDELLWGRS